MLTGSCPWDDKDDLDLGEFHRHRAEQNKDEDELEAIIAALVKRKNASKYDSAEHRFIERQLNALRYTYERAGEHWESIDICWDATPLAETENPEGKLLPLRRKGVSRRDQAASCAIIDGSRDGTGDCGDEGTGSHDSHLSRACPLDPNEQTFENAHRLFRDVPIAAVSNRSNAAPYSITSSVRPMSGSDKVRPSALAALRLTTNSNLVGC